MVGLFITEVPTALPPLTPGTNRKVNEVLKASFASWEKEVQNCNITKGKKKPFLDNIILKNSRFHQTQC